MDLKTLKAIYASAQRTPATSEEIAPTAPPTPTASPERKHESTPMIDSLRSLPLTTIDDSDSHMMVVLSESMMQTATPRHAHHAVGGPRSKQWIDAMNREKALKTLGWHTGSEIY